MVYEEMMLVLEEIILEIQTDIVVECLSEMLPGAETAISEWRRRINTERDSLLVR